MIEKTKEYDATALLAILKVAPGSPPEKGLLSWSRPYLVESVRDLGVDMHTIRGADAIDTEAGFARNVSRPEYIGNSEVTIHQLGDRALESYGVMRTIIKAQETDDLVRGLNPTALRKMARNKHTAAETLLRPTGAYERESLLVEPGESSDDAIGVIGSELLVAKPAVGRMSRGVMVGKKHEIANHLSDQEVPFLVEEKIDFTAAFPQIKGADEQQQARLDEANRLGVNKELRMYYFGDNIWDSVMRVAKPGEVDFRSDEWLYIDMDTIPDEIYTMSIDVIGRIKQQIGTDEVNVALDWVYGSTASNPDPHWQVMELNIHEPQLVQEHEDMTVSRRQHTKLATQIARIAVS